MFFSESFKRKFYELLFDTYVGVILTQRTLINQIKTDLFKISSEKASSLECLKKPDLIYYFPPTYINMNIWHLKCQNFGTTWRGGGKFAPLSLSIFYLSIYLSLTLSLTLYLTIFLSLSLSCRFCPSLAQEGVCPFSDAFPI